MRPDFRLYSMPVGDFQYKRLINGGNCDNFGHFKWKMETTLRLYVQLLFWGLHAGEPWCIFLNIIWWRSSTFSMLDGCREGSLLFLTHPFGRNLFPIFLSFKNSRWRLNIRWRTYCVATERFRSHFHASRVYVTNGFKTIHIHAVFFADAEMVCQWIDMVFTCLRIPFADDRVQRKGDELIFRSNRSFETV